MTPSFAITQNFPSATPIEDHGASHFPANGALNNSPSSSHELTAGIELIGCQYSLNAIVPAPDVDMHCANLQASMTESSVSLHSFDAFGSRLRSDTVPGPRDYVDTPTQSPSNRDGNKYRTNSVTYNEPSREESSTCPSAAIYQLIVGQDVSMLSLPNPVDLIKPWPLAHMKATMPENDPSASIIATNSSQTNVHTRDATPEKNSSAITAPKPCDISSDSCPFTPTPVIPEKVPSAITSPNICAEVRLLARTRAATPEEGLSAIIDMGPSSAGQPSVCCFNIYRISSSLGDRFSQESTSTSSRVVFRRPLIGYPFPRSLQEVRMLFAPQICY
jgi:hypothetical protein